jgi:tetratricopeptide (TPR) repeat protein
LLVVAGFGSGSRYRHSGAAVVGPERSLEMERDPWALASLGSTLLEMQETPGERALTVLREAIELDPTPEQWVRNRYADALRLAGFAAEANKQYRLVLAEAGRSRAPDPSTLHGAAWSSLMVGEVEEAIRRLLKVVDTNY